MFINDLFNKKQLDESLRDGEYVTFLVKFDDGTTETLNFSSDDIDWDRVGARRNKKVVDVKQQGGIQGSEYEAPKRPHQFPDDSFARAQRAYDRKIPESKSNQVPWDAVVNAIVYDQFDTLMDRYGLTFDDVENIVRQHGFQSSDDVKAEYSNDINEAYDTSPNNREYFDDVKEWARAVLEDGGEVVKARGVYVAHGWEGEMGEFDPNTGEGWLVDKIVREQGADSDNKVVLNGEVIGHLETDEDGDPVGVVYDGDNRPYKIYGYNDIDQLKREMVSVYNQRVRGVAEGSADERKENRLRAMITDYEQRAKATKNDIKRDHYMKMAKQLRDKLKTSDVDEGVAEGEKKPHPKTWHDVDKKLGKAVDKMSQAEKVKKGLAHPDTLKKKGVAEAKHFRTAYGWAGGYNEKTGKSHKHPEQIKADRDAKKQAKEKQAKEKSVAEGVKVIDQDSDLDQQVFTLNVDGKKVSFTYWDYETNFQSPDIKDIYQQAKEQLSRKLSPEQIKDVARAVFKSVKQGVEEGLKFHGGFPDVDHMRGAVHRDADMITDNVKTKNKEEWDRAVDSINARVFDDMAEFRTDSRGERVTGNSAVWAKWDNETQTGWFNAKGRPLKPWPVKEQDVAEANDPFSRWAKELAAQNRARAKAEQPPKLPKQPASLNKPKLTLDQVWNKVEYVIGEIFPDGDPIDYLAPWLEKHGVRDFKIGEVLDRAAKKHGYKDMYDYYDSLKDMYPELVNRDMSESGPFNYGVKKPRKGSVADLAAKKRQEQERDKQPVEPRDQMVGIAKILPGKARGDAEYKVTNEDVTRYVDELDRAGYEIVTESATLCPECGGVAYSNRVLAEKQDACYHKVKSRYKVWPSAYASGALVQCRKKGAANWGNKGSK